VGESTTAIGGENSYPYQLQEILNQRNIGVKLSVVNEGIPTGNTMAILAELEDNLNVYNPDMVIAMMGANDGGSYVHYGKISGKEVSGRQSLDLSKIFRTYRLVQFLWFQAVNKDAALRGDDSGGDIADVINALTQPKSRKEVEAITQKVYQESGLGSQYLFSAIAYLEQNKFRESGECFERLIEMGFDKEIMKIEPKNCWMYSSLGECYKEPVAK
jgi:lysophospholipase L1-like esterase